MPGAFDMSEPVDKDVDPAVLANGEYRTQYFSFKKSDNRSIWVNINSEFIAEGMDFCRKNHIDSIALNTFNGYHLQNTDFLKDYPLIKQLRINGSYMDKSGIYALPQLEDLSLDDWNSDIDLRRFPQLKSFGGDCNKELIWGPEHKCLECIGLGKFPGNDLRELPLMPNLKHLYLVQAKIKTLNGVERFPRLRSLVLGYSRTLTNINALSQSQIKWLEVDSCSKIEDITDVLKSVPSLQGIKLRGKITMPSVDFVRFLPQLRYFYFCDCNVINGDMSPCEGIEFVYFKNKRHFSPKYESFKRASKSFITIENEIIYG